MRAPAPARARHRTLVTTVLATVVAALLGAGVLLPGAARASAAPASTAPGISVRSLRVPVGAEPGGAPVSLDASLFVPATASAAHPAPAVLLAHGFGGTKASVAGQARTLAAHGYVVLTWTARGFEASGGSVHLDSPQYEVADAARLVDLLGHRADVERDGPDDPRVGVAGASYGGALGLLLAGTDPRVDAVAAAITWDDLGSALEPQSVVAPASSAAQAGVFKAGWAAQLATSLQTPVPSTAAGSPAPGVPGAGQAACGRLAASLCPGYLQAATTGVVSAGLRAQLSASSPVRVLGHTRAPVLLDQGESDSLFGLEDSLADAAAARASGEPTQLVWSPGGHDGGFDTTAFTSRALTWFGRYLRHDGSRADTRFDVAVPAADSTGDVAGGSGAATYRTLAAPPGAPGQPARTEHLALSPAPGTPASQTALSPPGGRPAALTTIPGLGAVAQLGALASALGAGSSTSSDSGTGSSGGGSSGAGSSGAGALSSLLGASLPGQAAVFQTAPLRRGLTLLGSSTVQLRVTSSAPDAVLFASLADVAADGTATTPSGLVAPLRVVAPAGTASTVTVRLPAVVRDVHAGDRLRLVVASTDSAFAVPVDARSYTIALAGGALAGSGLTAALAPPAVAAAAPASASVPWPQVVGAAAAVALVAALTAVGALRRRAASRSQTPGAGVASAQTRGTGSPGAEPDSAGTPVLQVSGVSKVYRDGFRAVDDASFTVSAGQVVGLLGPNGAGKTTTLRMLLGLLRPTSGQLAVLGVPVTPGAGVLAQVGALVEGPGFLPHLTGMENLRAFWRATGRPLEQAHLEEALEVAGLGDAVHRRVRSYSQGMRQRLGIAQAMLGRPQLLVLDEPTNGLDPPQITAMRQVLRDYAGTGRTVLVSSHLLSEVEQTCTHAVVMARGKVLATGSVAELAGGSGQLLLAVPSAQRAAAAVAASGAGGAVVVGEREDGVLVEPGPGGAGALVRALVGAGVEVEGVVPQRHLEEVFLDLVAGLS